MHHAFRLGRYAMWQLLALLSLLGLVRPSLSSEFPSDHPFSLPRESGFLGSSYTDIVQKYGSIGADGDLRVSIPLLEVPGILPVPLALSYKSGITLDQPATWVGLGWNLGGWSVKRIAVHGDDVHSLRDELDSLIPNRFFVSDVYQVDIPGKSFRFFNKGSRDNPEFVPMSHALVFLKGTVDSQLTVVDDQWYYRKINSFVLRDSNETRYVFTKALKRTTIGCVRSDLICRDEEFSCFFKSTYPENSEWLLTAILSHDYRDVIGDPLNPLDCGSYDPRLVNRGWWVAFIYSADGLNEGTTRMVSNSDWRCGEVPDYGYQDRTEYTYLKKIITPATVVDFELRPVREYLTIRYYRFGQAYDSGGVARSKELVLSRLRAYAYSGVGTRPEGQELAGVTFNYEYSGTIPLKRGWHMFLNNPEAPCPISPLSRHGEPTLRSVVFGTDNMYDTAASSNARELVRHGLKRRFEFSYDTTLDLPTGWFYQQYGRNTSDDYRLWCYGMDNDLEPSVLYPSWPGCTMLLYSQSFVQTTLDIFRLAWGARDFFGYHYLYPWAWSLTSMTTPEGLKLRYEYESDRYAVRGSRWCSGGCRVRSILINPQEPASDGRDMRACDTILVKYGDSPSDTTGIGYATSMPTNWLIFTTAYSDSSAFRHEPSHRIHFTHGIRFLGDNVDHVIQYRCITSQLPRQHGFIDHYYLTADSVGAHRPLLMTAYRHTEPPRTFHHFYGFWLDRSPLHGINYKTVYRDSAGAVLYSKEDFYAWFPSTARVFPRRDPYVSCECDSGGLCNDGCTTSRAFPMIDVGGALLQDTAAVSYVVRIDSTVTGNDGVRSTRMNRYNDEWQRLTAFVDRYNDREVTTHFQYAAIMTDQNDTGKGVVPVGQRYLALVQNISRFTDTLALSETRRTYTNSLPSAPSGIPSVYYLQRTVDVSDIAGDSLQQLTTEVLDVDAYGNATRLWPPDGTKTAYGYTYRGLEARIDNVQSEGIFFFTAETRIHNQPAGFSIGNPHTTTYSPAYAFTGEKSLRMEPGPGSGLQVDLGSNLPAGLYVAECWAYTPSVTPNPGAIRLITLPDSTFAMAHATEANRWERLVCTLSVNGSQRLLFHTRGGSAEIYFDDLRIYPVGTLMTTYTYDGLCRVTAVSDHNNMPTRTYYDQFGGVLATADGYGRSLSGTELFYKPSETLSGHSPAAYVRDMPNVIYSIAGKSPGVVEDFSAEHSTRYTVLDSNATVRAGALYFTSSIDDIQKHSDALFNVGRFENCVLAFDFRDSSYVDASATTTTDTTFRRCNLWFGFENDDSRGYAFCISRAGDYIVFKYHGGQYDSVTVIDSVDIRLIYPAHVRNEMGKRRFMIARLGRDMYFFLDGDCLYRTTDSSTGYESFSKVRFRFRNPQQGFTAQDRCWLDNVVFYNDPVVTTAFVNAFGMTKQTQVFDGTAITVSGSTNTCDFLPEAEFSAIALHPDSVYGEFAGVNTAISPFDFIDQYLVSSSMTTWSPGDALDDSALIVQYFDNTQGAPNVRVDGLAVPYAERVYCRDPLRRISEMRPQGVFRDHQVRYQYGHNEGTLPWFSGEGFTHGCMVKQTAIDEDGNATVSYADGRGHVIATGCILLDTLTVDHHIVEVGVGATAQNWGPLATTWFDSAWVIPPTLEPNPQVTYLFLRVSNTYPDSSDTVYSVAQTGATRSTAVCDTPGVYSCSHQLLQQVEIKPYDVVWAYGAASSMRIPNDYHFAHAGFAFSIGTYGTEADTLNPFTRFYADALGRDTLIAQPNGLTAGMTYCMPGWLTSEWDNDHGRTDYMYDEAGNIRFLLTTLDSTTGRFHVRKYDRHNRVIEEGVTAASMLYFFTWHYACMNNFPDTASGYTVLARYAYDTGEFGLGRLVRAESYPSGARDSVSWVELDYDERGQVVETRQHVNGVDSCGGYRTIRVSYDNLGNTTRITYDNGKYIDYRRNHAGRVVRVSDDAGIVSVGIEYWPDGHIKRQVLGGDSLQSVDYRYNARGWLESINNGRVDTAQNGLGDHFALNLSYTDGACRGRAGLGGDYEFPEGYYNGNIAAYSLRFSPGTSTGDTASQCFAYDGMGRLVAVKHACSNVGSAIQRIWYDRNSNIDSVLQPDDQLWDYIYQQSTNRLAVVYNRSDSSNVYRLRYTLDGDVSQYVTEGMDITYDPYRRMSARSVPGAHGRDMVRYWYNTGGQRIGKLLSQIVPVECDTTHANPRPKGGATSPPPVSFCFDTVANKTGYYYLGNEQLFDYGGPRETDLIGNYVYVDGRRVAKFGGDQPDRVHYYVTDHLGSVVATVGWQGSLTSRNVYDAYGEKLSASVTATGTTKYGFTGHELDEELGHELYYCGARYYDPGMKVFTQPDPAWAKTPSLGRYVYCAGNPMRLVDPDGKNPFWVVVAALAYLLSTPDDAVAPTLTETYKPPTLGQKVMQQANGICAAAGVLSLARAFGLGSATEAALTEEATAGAAGTETAEAAAGEVTSNTAELLPGPNGGTSWTTARRCYWQSEAETNPARFSEENLQRAKKGKAETQVNPETGKRESKQLHHKTPRSQGGEHTRDNLQELWPDEHRDVHRNLD